VENTPQPRSGRAAPSLETKCIACGYDRRGLDDSALCPECGERCIEPDGLVASLRHAWNSSTSWTMQAIWVIGCICAGVAALVMIGMFLALILVITDRADGSVLALPIAAWIFGVGPIALLVLFCVLGSLGAADHRLARYGGRLAIAAVVAPIVTMILVILLARAIG